MHSDPHRLTVAESLVAYGTTTAGLAPDEVLLRARTHGRNELLSAPPRSALRALLAQFADFMIVVLLAAAAVAGMVGDVTDTIVILAIVVLNACIGFVQERRAETALHALRAMAAPSATVRRNGRERQTPAADLVPGDLVLLEAGRIVPADLRLVEAAQLTVDEAVLTGESNPVDKVTKAIAAADAPLAERYNIAFKGTHVLRGRGVGIVVATGMQTQFGRIAALLASAAEVETPLQRRLTVFGRQLALVVIAICGVVFATGLLRGEPALPMLLTALSLAVAAIPEALPAVLTIALALGARRLVAARALIRRLPAVEALGSVTVICSDKTGTLTANRMQVDCYYCEGREMNRTGSGPTSQELLTAMAVSSDVLRGPDGSVDGDPTEVALLQAAERAGTDPWALRAAWPRCDEVPFDSERRCMTTVHARGDGRWIAFTKGAAEAVIARAIRELYGDGERPIDAAQLARQAEAMAARGLRVLAVARRCWSTPPRCTDAHTTESGLTFLGLVGLLDPPRPEAAPAIAECRAAGIVPVMITGDHPLTARAVAQRLGLIEDPDQLATGSEIEALDDAALEQRAGQLRVYARISPEQKLRIVGALQRRGAIVAMTGDGVNDAPALRRAEIGVAMGITGTDVAREASSMVLLDDNFATIVRAVREGRRTYDNLRRFVRYVLTTNSAEIWTIFLAPLLGMPIPFLPIQILWINLVTDGLPGLALAAERAERDAMRRPPRPPHESLFARGLGLHALFVGLLMAGLTLGVQAAGLAADEPQWRTVTFTTLCFAQLGHVLAIRSESQSLFAIGIASNRPLLAAVLVTVALQLAVMYTPAGNAWFRTVPLAAADLAVCVAAALVILTVVEIEKAFWRRSAAGSQAHGR